MTFDSKTLILVLGIVAVIVVVGALLVVRGVNGPESVSQEGEGVVSQEEGAPIPPATGDVDDVVDALLRDAQEEDATVNAQGDDTQFEDKIVRNPEHFTAVCPTVIPADCGWENKASVLSPDQTKVAWVDYATGDVPDNGFIGIYAFDTKELGFYKELSGLHAYPFLRSYIRWTKSGNDIVYIASACAIPRCTYEIRKLLIPSGDVVTLETFEDDTFIYDEEGRNTEYHNDDIDPDDLNEIVDRYANEN